MGLKHITKKTGDYYQLFCGKVVIFETNDHTYQIPDGWECPVCNEGIKQIMQEIRKGENNETKKNINMEKSRNDQRALG